MNDWPNWCSDWGQSVAEFDLTEDWLVANGYW